MSTQINALLENDDRIVTLLRLARQLIEAIHPDQSANEADEAADSHRRAIIEQRAGEFYKTLNDVQVGLRDAIAELRRRRISIQPLLYTSALRTAAGAPIGPGVTSSASKSAGEDGAELSVGAQKREQAIWKEIADALEVLKSDARLDPDAMEA